MKPSGIKILIFSLGFSANVLASVATDESCEKGYVGVESFASCEGDKFAARAEGETDDKDTQEQDPAQGENSDTDADDSSG